MLDEGFKRQLKAELERLLQQKALLESTIAHVEALMDAEDIPAQMSFADVSSKPLSDGSAPRKGLRALVQEVLADHPNGLRASEVAAQLTQRRFAPSGKSTLRTLVSSELSRLKRQEKVRKRGSKYLPSKEKSEKERRDQGPAL